MKKYKSDLAKRIDKLTKGKPYSLISKGISRGLVQSIMGGSSPSADKIYEVAKALGVFTEELVTGIAPQVVEVYDKNERKEVEKLLRILRTKQNKTVLAIKQNLDAFLDNPDKEKGMLQAAKEEEPYNHKKNNHS